MRKCRRAVEEREQPDHAAEADQVRKPKQLAQRRDGKRDHNQAEGPVAGEVGEEVERIGRQSRHPEMPKGVVQVRLQNIREDHGHQVGEWHQAEQE